MRINDVRSKMKNAMITLLRKKNYLQITVTDLVAEAGVARASFYRVYTSIDKVLDDVYSDIKERLVSRFVPSLLNKDTEALREQIIDFLNQIKAKEYPTISVLPENRQFMLPKFESQFVNYKDSQFKNINDKFKIPAALLLIYYSSIIWSYYDYVESVDEVADYILDRIYLF